MKKCKFSGHQTFCLRYGWLEKGLRYVLDGGAFSAADALVRLGVGKNMVSSIEYWCKNFGLIDSNGKPSDFGIRLLGNDTAWDPFLEDEASWWLLHWKMVAESPFITSGTMLFSDVRKTEFSRADVMELINKKYLSGAAKVSPSILERDVDCYLRSYYTKKSGKGGDDGLFECPFQDLHLIEPLEGVAGSYRFNIGSKHSLPPLVLGYALWAMLQTSGQDSLRLQEALYGEYSPGQVFMLDENSFVEAILTLHTMPELQEAFDITESAGIARVHCRIKDGLKLLELYYRGA